MPFLDSFAKKAQGNSQGLSFVFFGGCLGLRGFRGFLGLRAFWGLGLRVVFWVNGLGIRGF